MHDDVVHCAGEYLLDELKEKLMITVGEYDDDGDDSVTHERLSEGIRRRLDALHARVSVNEHPDHEAKRKEDYASDVEDINETPHEYLVQAVEKLESLDLVETTPLTPDSTDGPQGYRVALTERGRQLVDEGHTSGEDGFPGLVVGWPVSQWLIRSLAEMGSGRTWTLREAIATAGSAGIVFTNGFWIEVRHGSHAYATAFLFLLYFLELEDVEWVFQNKEQEAAWEGLKTQGIRIPDALDVPDSHPIWGAPFRLSPKAAGDPGAVRHVFPAMCTAGPGDRWYAVRPTTSSALST